jgi:hypothetical protein
VLSDIDRTYPPPSKPHRFSRKNKKLKPVNGSLHDRLHFGLELLTSPQEGDAAVLGSLAVVDGVFLEVREPGSGPTGRMEVALKITSTVERAMEPVPLVGGAIAGALTIVEEILQDRMVGHVRHLRKLLIHTSWRKR